MLNLLPDLKSAPSNYSTQKHVQWSVVVMIIYVFLANLPVFTFSGINNFSSSDPFMYLRIITASARNSFVELGVVNFVIAWTIVAYYRKRQKKLMTKFDDKNDYENINHLYKTLTLIITFVLILVFIVAGVFGKNLSLLSLLLILVQLLISNILLIYLDEFIRKGWGFNSGVSLYIIGATLSNIMWSLFTFSPVIDGVADGSLMNPAYGAITALFSALSRVSMVNAINIMFFRIAHPTASLFAMIILIIAIFIVYKYLKTNNTDKILKEQTFLSINTNNSNTTASSINIALLTKIIDPIYIAITIDGLIFITIYFMTNFFPNNAVIDLLGTFSSSFNNIVPAGGLIYYLTAPRGILGVGAIISTDIFGTILSSTFLSQPARIVVYSAFILGLTYIITKYFYSCFIIDEMSDKTKINEYTQVTLTLAFMAIVAEILGALISGFSLVITVVLIFSYKKYLPETNQHLTNQNTQKLMFITRLAIFSLILFVIIIFENSIINTFVPRSFF